MTDVDEARAVALREALVAELREYPHGLTDRVVEAFRTVPRHVFVPGVPLEVAYAVDRSLVVGRDVRGDPVSTVSAPRMQALMVGQADVRPGMRVLEIGSGGYCAAVLAELVGQDGAVTTMDIDSDVVDRTRHGLAEAGYSQVAAVVGDGEYGMPGRGPFDRVIVTVGAWDIPPAWTVQLAEGGRLVVPLRIRGLMRLVVFERDDRRLVSRGCEPVEVEPIQGVGELRERVLGLDEAGSVRLRLDDGQQVDAGQLRAAAAQPCTATWSGEILDNGDRAASLCLWLATKVPVFGLLERRNVVGRPTALDGDSFAYLELRSTTLDPRLQYSVHGHGPRADELVGRMVRHVRAWERRPRRARIEVHPAGAPDSLLPEPALVIDKRHSRVAVTWPAEPAT